MTYAKKRGKLLRYPETLDLEDETMRSLVKIETFDDVRKLVLLPPPRTLFMRAVWIMLIMIICGLSGIPWALFTGITKKLAGAYWWPWLRILTYACYFILPYILVTREEKNHLRRLAGEAIRKVAPYLSERIRTHQTFIFDRLTLVDSEAFRPDMEAAQLFNEQVNYRKLSIFEPWHAERANIEDRSREQRIAKRLMMMPRRKIYYPPHLKPVAERLQKKLEALGRFSRIFELPQ